MEVATGDFWNIRQQDFTEKIGSARDFPCIKTGSEFFSAIPQVISLFFHFSGRNRVSRDGQSALMADSSAKLRDVRIGIDPLLDAERDNVRAAGVAHAVFCEFKAGDQEHAVLFPGTHTLGADNFEVQRKSGRSQRVLELPSGLS